MRHLTILIFFLIFKLLVFSQDFLKSFEKYKLNNASKISNAKTRTTIKNFIKSQTTELDTIFKSYKSKTNFDFNNADTLFFIYVAPAESPFTSDVLIWSSTDTISYRQGFETIKLNKYKRIITYSAIRSLVDKSTGLKVTTEKDSLITLVSKRDYNTINHLGDNQHISDGNYVTIYVAYKTKEQYKIEYCSPPQFIIKTTYRKE